MGRILPLLVVAACPLALLACDDSGGADPIGSGTVAVATLDEASVPPPSTDAPASTEPTDSTESTDSTERAAPSTDAERATTTTAPPTRLADDLADLFAGKQADAPASGVVVDDTGRLRMEVPSAWADRRTSPSPLTEGAAVPSLTAAVDQTKFLDGYGAPGLTAVVVDSTPVAALDAYTFADCDDGGRTPFRTARLSGMYEVWRGCGETATSIVTVAVRPTRGDETVLLLAQVLTPSDLAALDQALATLQLRPA
jgi:hypothetical protein